MKQYLDLLEDVLENGALKEDRTGTGTRSVFGRQYRVDLAKGFPLLTTKKVFFKAVVNELLWFLSGSTNINDLHENVRQGKMALPPCHLLYQFQVINNKLNLMCTIRSNDLFLGHPFNTAQAALWVYMLAQQCDLEVGELIMSIGDAHIYSNHMEQVKTQLTRKPTELPQLKLKRKPASIYDYKLEDFELIGYDPQPAIKAPVAI